MTQSVLADTGPLYAAVDPDDQHHARALEDIRALNEARLGVAALYSNLLEGYSLVLYKRGVKVAQRWLVEVETSSVLLNPTSDDYQAAFRLVTEFPDQRISLFDAILSVVARRLELMVWTFDHQFDVMGANVWRH